MKPRIKIARRDGCALYSCSGFRTREEAWGFKSYGIVFALGDTPLAAYQRWLAA